MTIERKRIRLPHGDYVGCGWFFVTFCCLRRVPVFKNPSACHWFLEVLRKESVQNTFSVHAYCIMPDHVHLLVEGLKAESDLPRFVKALKQRSGHFFKRKTGRNLWQRFFYDHILRPNESPDSVAWYIWLNPVRKDICADPKDFPFSGSFTGAWSQPSSQASAWVPSWKTQKLAT